jgi:beta-lactamase regulating signal transducer with metallopeptidase domain
MTSVFGFGASDALRVFLEVAVKGTLLIAIVAIVAASLRSVTASLRHLLWSSTLVAMLAIPALMLVLPRWQMGLLSSTSVTALAPSELDAPSSPPVATEPATPINAPAGRVIDDIGPRTPKITEQRPLMETLSLLWLGGVAVGIITLVGGLLTLRRVARRAVPLASPEWKDLAAELHRDLGLRRNVRLLSSRSAAMPATWGVINPVVLFPADADEWDADRRRVVLLHELAHVKRNDCLTQIIAQICCAVYWFHPGVWYSARRLRSERELACDEHVLDVGVNACDYAAHLLEIARVCKAPFGTSAAAVAMARPSQLEGRLLAILDSNVASRWRGSRPARRATIAALTIVTIPLAAMTPWSDGQLASTAKDDFHWKGVVPRGKWVEVLALYGDMRVEPSTTNEVEILAVRKVGDPKSYRIATESDKNGNRFCVISSSVKSLSPCRTGEGLTLGHGVRNTRVDFLVKVPAGVGVSLHTGRGNIAAEGVHSYVWGTADKGDISIVTTDLAEASTNVGSISAEFGRTTWKQDLEFLTENGDVTVVAPSNANMMIQMETGAGKVRSEFSARTSPLGGGVRSVASAGRGGGMLTLRTGRGTVELKRGPDATSETSDMSSSYSDAPFGSVDPKPNPNLDPNFDPNPNPDPAIDPDPNPNPGYNGNPNPDVEVGDNSDPTGEIVPVNIPANFLSRYSDAAIRGWRDAEAIARLRNIAATHVKQHQSDLVKERAEWALTLVRDGLVINALHRALSHRDWRVRAYAAWCIGEVRDPRAAEWLTAALRDEHWRVRMHAAGGLERIAGQAQLEPLIGALSDDYWQVRISAVDALASIGGSRALASLRSVAEHDPRWIVRDQAANAIQKIK